jgi:CRISPR-associated endonuclease/helicase Cas3
VNRRGDGDANIDVVHEPIPAEPEFELARQKTLDLFNRNLPSRSDNRYDASPEALRKLPDDKKQEAFSPAPEILPTSEILFDSWALTTINELPGRPPVDAWLHGREEDMDETHFAWRTEVELLRVSVMGEDLLRERTEQVRSFLDEYPLKSIELLRVPTSQVKDTIKKLAKRSPDATAWVLGRLADPRLTTLSELAENDYPSFTGRTIVLGPHTGGLSVEGRLDSGAEYSRKQTYDVADINQKRRRFEMIYEDGESKYFWNGEDFTDGMPDATNGMTLVAEIPLEETDEGTSRSLLAYVGQQQIIGDESQSRGSTKEISLVAHNAQVGRLAADWAVKLDLAPDVQTAIRVAARCHDLGKDRKVWQRSIGNQNTNKPLAKSGHARFLQGLEGYRHEFGSLVDVHADPEFSNQRDEVKDLILHLIAAHHGYGRPLFPIERAFDPQTPNPVWESLPVSVIQRFTRLQSTYGRWGLAYLESLIRSADIAASREPEITSPETVVPQTLVIDPLPVRQKPKPTINVTLDPTNPGQFFACCGLLELANRLWDGVEGWFAKDNRSFNISGSGTLEDLIRAVTTAKLTLHDTDDIYSGRFEIGSPFRPLLLDWWHENGGRSDAKDLKIWAGTMESYGIAVAMQKAMRGEQFQSPELFNVGMVVPDPNDAKKKKEPYYYDARRGPNAHSRDVGFSPNDLSLTTTAFPAVEFLCLVGLQRCQPAKTEETRIYDFFTWTEPLPPALLPAVVSGLLPHVGAHGYRFENWFRTGQRKHKAFRSAIPLSPQGAQ